MRINSNENPRSRKPTYISHEDRIKLERLHDEIIKKEYSNLELIRLIVNGYYDKWLWGKQYDWNIVEKEILWRLGINEMEKMYLKSTIFTMGYQKKP